MKRDELLVPGEYHSTPDVVMARRDITSTAKCVYSAILSHLRAGDEWVWPSIPRIVAMTGTPRRSVIRATGQLEDAGLLERGEHGRSTRYRFLNPLPTPVAKAVPACPQTPPKHCAQQCHSGTGAKMAQVPKTTGTGAKMAQTGAKMAHQALKETLKETLKRNSGKPSKEFSPETAKKEKKEFDGRRAKSEERKGEENPPAGNHQSSIVNRQSGNNGWHHLIEGIGTPFGQRALAETLITALKTGKGNAAQLSADRSTFKRIARHVAAGSLGKTEAALGRLLLIAKNIGQDYQIAAKGKAFVGEVKKDLAKAGKSWESVE